MSIWESCPAVWRDSERMGGVWTFRGTRVPIEALFDNLNDGASVEDFLEWYEGVELWQAEAVIAHQAKRRGTLVTGENTAR